MKRIIFFLVAFIIAQPVKSQENISTAVEEIGCGDVMIHFVTSCSSDLPEIRFIHVHENEKTAVQVAYNMLDKYGKGCFSTWKTQDDRYVSFTMGSGNYKFDPNRIFSEKGRRETLDSNGDYSQEAADAVAVVAELFEKNYVDSNRLVVAMHNNTNDGGLTIRSYAKGGDYSKDAKKVYINKTRDVDDFFITTDERIYDFLKKKKFNIMLQDNANANDDGSLSIYAAAKGIAYLNVEAEHGHLQQQTEMMRMVFEMIRQIFPSK